MTSLKGKILVSKSLILSKIWYYVPVCPPPSSTISALQKIINKFIWSSSHCHPSFQTSSLSITLGGINFPDIQKECQIRHAKLISRTFDPDPPFWIKSLNQLAISIFNRSLPACIILQHGTYHNIEPLHSFLNAAKLIEQSSPSTILSSPSLPILRSVLISSPSPPISPYSPFPYFPNLTWKEIHHKHYPHKVSDLLWKISHHTLPVGPPVVNISPNSHFCPWCPSIINSIPHLFHHCHITSTLLNLTNSICHLVSPVSNISSLIFSPHSQIKHIGHLIFASFIWTIWTSYTSCTFNSSSSIPSLIDIFKSFLSILLHNKSLYQTSWWPSNSQITKIIQNAIVSSLPPPPTIIIYQ